MLSVGRLGKGQEAYFEASVVRDNAEAYYAGKGEAPGRWLGEGAQALGLAGEVGEGALSALMAGLDPTSLEPIRSAPIKKVVGFDLTLSAPKSVSVLWALGDREVAGQLVEAHEAAVTAAIGYMQDTAMRVRRGRGGLVTEHGRIVVAAYRHRVSRAQDPQLHTHAVCPNLAQGADGRWTALDSRMMYRAAQTAGYLYQAHLRHEVSRRLGLEWGPVHKGSAELEVIPADVRTEFSRRKAEIEAVAKEHGAKMGGPAAASVAVLTSRDRKAPIDMPAWLLEVRERASDAGLDLAELDVLVRDARARAREAPTGADAPAPLDFRAVSEHLVSPEGLTEKHTSFGVRTILRAFAEQAAQGATVDQVRAYGETFAGGNPEVLQLVNGKGRPIQEWSTQELTDVERAMVESAAARQDEGCAVLDERKVVRSVEPFGLNEGQAKAVRAVTTSGNGVDVIQALAGAGKTRSAGAIRQAYEDAGYTVVGVAPTARAQRELATEAGIPSRTLASTVMALDAGERLGWRSVVVVDEAGMAGTRDMAELERHAREAGAKMVVIGDPGQLHSVQAGGWLRTIATRVGWSFLREVHRQNDKGERRALGQLHAKNAAGYLEWAGKQGKDGRVNLSGSLAGAVDAWADATKDVAPERVALITRSNELRAELNERARAVHRERGHLGDEIGYGPVMIAVGDRVICRQNSRMIDVDNGTKGTVTRVTSQAVDISLDGSDRTRYLPAAYVAAHVEHAYALTAHGMQGSTVDRAIVVGEPHELTNGWAYTALSRARGDTSLHVLQPLPDAEREEYAPHEIRERRTERQLEASLARYMARPDDESVAFDRIAFERGLDRDVDDGRERS